jgi:hypothetical protein
VYRRGVGRLVAQGTTDMNYNRRANRPDANHYRETRRRGMFGKSRGSTGPRRRSGGRGWVLLLLLFLVVTGAAAWMYLR